MKAILKEIHIESFGKIEHQTLSFNPGINIIKGETLNELLMVINMLFYIEQSKTDIAGLRPNTEIKGMIEIAKEVCEVSIINNGNCPEYRILNINTGKDITCEYIEMMWQSEENKAADMFSHNIEYHKRMCRLLDPNKEDRLAIPKLTNGLGNTQTCRKYLREVIKDFQDKVFINDINDKLSLSTQGEFFLEDKKGNYVFGDNLEHSKKQIFEFRCFLEYSEIWNELELIKDFNHIEKPILVADSSDFSDQDTVKTIIKKMSGKTKRQIFIFD